MSRDLVFVDTETTGFEDNPDAEVFELAYSGLTGPIRTLYFGVEEVPQVIDDLTGFTARNLSGLLSSENDFDEFLQFSKDATMVSANPPFDRTFLNRAGLWSQFHYRSLDIESFALAKIDFGDVPGMSDIYRRVTDMGYNIPKPDHTAAGDVAALRAIYAVLKWQFPYVNKYHGL